MNRFDFNTDRAAIARFASRVRRKLNRCLVRGSGRSRPLAPLLDHVPQARAVTEGPLHHFFGYYEKCPWDANGRYLLAHEVAFADRMPGPGEPLAIGMIDLEDRNRFVPIDHTTAWCWQQGSMLQWLGSDPSRLLVYNIEDGHGHRARVRDLVTGDTRILPRPVYAVSPDGTQAVSLDFARLHWLQPGYGYLGDPRAQARHPAPDDEGISWMDMKTGASRLVVSLQWAAANRPDERFPRANHWFVHLQFNPSGNRVVFLHRWARPGQRRWTRMYVMRPDGTDVRLLADNGMVSHFDWRDDTTLLAWSLNDRRERRFQLFDARTGFAEGLATHVLDQDGHCTYSPNREWILNDTYPDARRYQTLMLYHPASNQRIDVLRASSSVRFQGEWRCDLHPRWNRAGTQVCFDSAHSGTRQLYVADVSAWTAEVPGARKF